MKQDRLSPSGGDEPRDCVEERDARKSTMPDITAVAENAQLLRELQVNQVELEMQNEELRETRLAMEAALEKYADLYEFAPMGYFTLDDNGVVLEANQTGMTLLGTVRSRLIGHPLSIFLAEESRAAFNSFLTELSGRRGKAACEAALLSQRAHAQWVRIHGIAEQGGGNEPHRCRIALTDITDAKDAEQEREFLRTQMLQARRLESLGALAGGIAHDFNNMLMAISGNAGLVLEDLPERASVRPMVQEIVTVAERAADLCTQMLAYAGKGHFQMSSLNLSKMAAEMSQMLAMAIPRKTPISCRLDDNLPLIRADAVQMRQVLMNLVINAAEAIGDTGGAISVSTGVRQCTREYLSQMRTAGVLAEGPYVFLDVADAGCGMDQATVEKMFDPFFSRKALGRGLGLSAVMGIVHAHSGGICVQTELNRGSTLTLLFPPEQTPDADVPVRVTPAADWKGKGTVLVVDDEEKVLSICRRMLQRLGFEVLVAGDGRDAVAVFCEHRDKIRCVLLDFAMPHPNGEETFDELRGIDPEVRVILSSGYLAEDVLLRFDGKGLAGFIHKPYKLEQLAESMKNVLAE